MRTFMTIVLVCSATACVGPEDETELPTVESAENSFTSEDRPTVNSEQPMSLAQDCVYIQWCDEPPAGGSSRVVGKVRPACFNQCWNDALINEFKSDARAVCGRTSLDNDLWRIDCF
jgi:hypothetical protein